MIFHAAVWKSRVRVQYSAAAEIRGDIHILSDKDGNELKRRLEPQTHNSGYIMRLYKFTLCEGVKGIFYILGS